MEPFKIEKWDKNTIGDVVCKELFKNASTIKGNAIEKNKNKKKVKNKSKKIKEVSATVPIVEKKRNLLIKKKKKMELAQKTQKNLETKKGHTVQLSKEAAIGSIKNDNKRKGKTKNKSISTVARDPKSPSTQPENVVNKKSKRQSKSVKEINSVNCPPNVAEPIEVVNQKKKRSLTDIKKDKIKEKLKQTFFKTDPSPSKKRNDRSAPLRERMMKKLKAARFRYLNEEIYSNDSKTAQNIFKSDPDAFEAYHEGYRQQVNSWPLNPLDNIINSIKKLPKVQIIADFGCGEAKLAQTVEQTVHSFDLVAANERVTACDMAHVPLGNNSVDVVVFCLSLMGTNLHDYLREANRVLKVGGILKIAEVESRFDDVNTFIEGLKRFNFKNTWKDVSHNLFYFLDFKKESNINNKKKVPTISLHPCLYKKR